MEVTTSGDGADEDSGGRLAAATAVGHVRGSPTSSRARDAQTVWHQKGEEPPSLAANIIIEDLSCLSATLTPCRLSHEQYY